MAEIIDFPSRVVLKNRELVAMAELPARNLVQLRKKARLLDRCSDKAEALLLFAHVLADIETLAAVEEARGGPAPAG